MATVSSIANAMTEYHVTYKREHDAIQTNRQLAADYKTQQTRDLFLNRIPGAENLGINLIGAPYQTDNGQTWASETGAIWKETAAAERVHNAARDESGNFPGDAAYWIARVNSIKSLAGTPDGLMQAYQAATDLEKIAMQDFLPGMITSGGIEMANVRRVLHNDGKARRYNAKVKAAEAALETLFDQIDTALIALRYLTDAFGRESAILPLLSRLYSYEKQYVKPSIDYPYGGMTRSIERVSYGAVGTSMNSFAISQDGSIYGGSME